LHAKLNFWLQIQSQERPAQREKFKLEMQRSVIKKAPDVPAVNQSVLQYFHPEQVEVEIWRAEALEVRRGLSSELDEM
jgi:hypothetical protein